MKIHLEIDLGIKEAYQNIKDYVLSKICAKKGHIWEKYEDFYGDSGFSLPSIWSHYMGLGEITHTCKRCGENKRKPLSKKGSVIKFRKYSKLK